MSLQERQAALIDTHRTIQDEGLPYVLVGGWAVSAFQTRFTTDVDMVLPEIAARELGLSPLEAEIILQALEPVASKYADAAA